MDTPLFAVPLGTFLCDTTGREVSIVKFESDFMNAIAPQYLTHEAECIWPAEDGYGFVNGLGRRLIKVSS